MGDTGGGAYKLMGTQHFGPPGRARAGHDEAQHFGVSLPITRLLLHNLAMPWFTLGNLHSSGYIDGLSV